MNRDGVFPGGKPEGSESRIENPSPVCAHNKTVVIVYIFANFHVCCVPDIRITGDLAADLLNVRPVVISVEFEAVSPNIQQLWRPVTDIELSGIYFECPVGIQQRKSSGSSKVF